MNVLTDRQRERIIERLLAGDSLRKIERETGHRRETVARVKRGLDAGRAPVAWGAPRRSQCEPFRGAIEAEVARGTSAWGIYLRLSDDFGFTGSYGAVKRFVRNLRPAPSRTATITALSLRRAVSPTIERRAAA